MKHRYTPTDLKIRLINIIINAPKPAFKVYSIFTAAPTKTNKINSDAIHNFPSFSAILPDTKSVVFDLKNAAILITAINPSVANTCNIFGTCFEFHCGYGFCNHISSSRTNYVYA